MKRLSGWRLATAAAAVAIVALGAALLSIERKAQQSASFCTERCHTSVAASQHRGVDCQECHAVSSELGRSLALNAALGETPPPHGAVDDASCGGCHEGTLAASEGHRLHARGQAQTACISCHGPGEHQAVTAEETCSRCHADARLHHASIEERCTDCHAFATTEAPPTVQVCASCHGKENASAVIVAEAVLHGEVDCTSCHNPHPATHGENVRGLDCSRCHQVDALGQGPAGHQKCQGCHQPHANERDAVASCGSCHAEQVRGASTALEHDDCSSCHLPHTWVAARAGCYKCHDDKVKQLVAKAPEAHGRCEDCHAPHEPPPTAATCSGCHQKLPAKNTPEGHAQCAGCHDPHGSASDARGSCAECHAPVAGQILASKLDGHIEGGCGSCHAAHGDAAMARARCDSCHRSQSSAVARAEPSEHRTCSSCHRSHTFAIESGRTEEACARCHETLVATRAVHGGDCKRCHTPHGSPSVTSAACVDCHRQVDAASVQAQGHSACDGCHAPHLPAENAANRCQSCHTAEWKSAAAWPRASPHEANCTACHQGHDVQRVARCAQCHVSEAQQPNKHECIQCHAPHRAPPSASERLAGGWFLRCASCHQTQARATSERGAKHARCASCHTPHKTEIAACTSCHQDMSRRALHARSEHRDNCRNCHATHEKSNIERAECLSCHRDKTNHKPDSPRCQVCHLFSL